MNKKETFKKDIILNERGDFAPYIIGWLLGVPGSVLLIIFLIRGCR